MPTVTPQALDDAIETIRKRTDALGVSEPEIQRSGRDQISIGLPDVQNAQRAIDQVGTTAQLQFYDWEPNVLGDRGPDAPYAGSKALFQAVEVASKQKPKAEQPRRAAGLRRVAAGGRREQRLHERPQYYLFGPDRLPIGPDKQPLRDGRLRPVRELRGGCSPTSTRGRHAEQVRQGHRVPEELRRSARVARRTARA